MKTNYLDLLSVYLTDTDSLHFEILEFFHFISPMPFEEQVRKAVVRRLKNAIYKNCTNIKVRPFGSYKTGLYLPISDIDISIDGEISKDKFNDLKDLLVTEGIADQENITTLTNTKNIPLIKYSDKESSINVDISLNNISGTRAVEFVKYYTKKFPNITPLFLLIRQLLVFHQLGEVYHGGLGSYSLLLMLVSFFQKHKRPNARSHKANLAILLVEFFELYGIHFQYETTGISVSGNGAYYAKTCVKVYLIKKYPQAIDHGVSFDILDPFDHNNIVTVGTYRIPEIKFLFQQCYNKLQGIVRENHLSQNSGFVNQRIQRGILAKIIEIPPKVNEFRQIIYYKYRKIMNDEKHKRVSFSTNIGPYFLYSVFEKILTFLIYGFFITFLGLLDRL